MSVIDVYKADVSIMLLEEHKPVDLSLGLKLTMVYYLVSDVVVDKWWLCITLFETQYELTLSLTLFNPITWWDVLIWTVYTANSSFFTTLLSIDLVFTNVWHLTSANFSTALHDVTPSWPLTYKLTTALAFLIAIRGCLPRYRYDFLTKLGWVKFLGQTLTFFLATAVVVSVA